jgi:hypothetical protein
MQDAGGTMKVTRLILFITVVVLGTRLFAQDRINIFGEYSYLHFSPTIAGVGSRSFNGGGVGLQLNFAKILGIKAEFMGYGSTTFTGNFAGKNYTANGNMFTYLFGPVLRIPIWRVKPFGEVLFGGSNTNAYVNLENAINAGGGTISKTPTQHPFTMAAGGGLDIDISHHIGIRPAEFDYVLSRYTNPLTSTNNQNNFRYCGGIILKF